MTEQETIQDFFERDVVIFDGAMGTEIYRRNVQTFRSFDELCLSEPDLIRRIHADYVNAGADVLTTNSYGANRVLLGKHGLDDKVAEINHASVALAREVTEAADRPVFVAGSVGPIPLESRFDEDCVAVLQQQIKGLVEGGVDLIIFESQPTRRQIESCARAMSCAPDMPYIMCCTVFSDCESVAGESLERLFAPIPDDSPQPFAVGMNCGAGPDALLTAAERVVHLVELPIVVIPNAGVPREIDNRLLYLCSPDYMAGYAKHYIEIGVRAIGGCCGTTPEHIQEIARRIKPLAKTTRKAVRVEMAESVQPQEPTPFAEKSRLAWRLANNHWVSTVEMVPPRGYNLRETLDKAKTLHRSGVDAINIPDGPRASSRLSPIITAMSIQHEAQIETILHFCSRDRNLIGMQADLFGCAVCEIRNILFVTGDPPKLGNYPFASGVFDVDSIGMCEVQKWLNQGIDIGGQAIEPKTNTVIGVGVDPNRLDQELELDRFRQKAEAGAEFAITQPVFDLDALRLFLDKAQKYSDMPVIAGIWPLASLRNATFLQNEVPGVVIPDDIMRRMAEPDNREDQRNAGIEIARESVEAIRDRISGIQVSAPFGNIQTALSVIVP